MRPSPRGPGLVTFGPDRVKDFCWVNNLQLIVRAHECVMDGFERFAQVRARVLLAKLPADSSCSRALNHEFSGVLLIAGGALQRLDATRTAAGTKHARAQGHLITLFSATNYCGTANNAGAILVLGRDLVMVPKLIHPLPPTGHQNAGMITAGPPGEGPILDTWMQSVNDERPPTPPRGRPDLANDAGASNLGYF